ncbi:MAG TPA: fibrillarin-like rRNA/tRNA 2'-O-methyltransferase [Candidatus Acidoferrum sp.]|nr:fibrillarin-like rRNA/tRNA 2'-O-methyltransferase [Candidatus Acidoferrum sp.]
MKIKELFKGVYSIDGRLATKSIAPGKKSYSEELVIVNKEEYRMWNPYRSKLSASISNGLKHFEFEEGSSVLYIGAATGTTASHISDIVKSGRVYCIELSERNMRELVEVCEDRRNMLPILADARMTETYDMVVEPCDVIYQDASAREQAEMLKKNSMFLKKGGYAYFIIKSQSVDVSKDPKDVFKSELALLEDEFEVLERVRLEPYDKMHLFVVMRKK